VTPLSLIAQHPLVSLAFLRALAPRNVVRFPQGVCVSLFWRSRLAAIIDIT